MHQNDTVRRIKHQNHMFVVNRADQCAKVVEVINYPSYSFQS